MAKSPVKYIGGKAASATHIVAHFPSPASYTRFVDVCGGAAHVLAAKPPYDHEELYNDLSDNLVTFWRVMQTQADTLQKALDAHLYARSIYYKYYRSLFDGTDLTPFDRALRWFYVIRSTGTGWVRKSPVGWDHRVSNVHSFRHALDLFLSIQERFRFVSVDNRDVLATIDRYDSPTTFFYIDPPYFEKEWYYEASKQGFPHEPLAQRLQSIKGKAAVSYYPHATLDLWYKDWERITWEQWKSSQIAVPGRQEDVATEMLLRNYTTRSVQPSLFVESELA